MNLINKLKTLLLNHPYIAGLASLVVNLLLITILAWIPIPIIQRFIEIDREVLVHTTTIIASLIVLAIHRFCFRKQNYKGVFTYTKCSCKDVWIAILIFAIIDVLSFVGGVSQTIGFNALVAPTAASIIMAMEAGVFEEVSIRAVPVSFFMTKTPDHKRVILAGLFTSLFFGLIHLSNMYFGAGLVITLYQVAYAFAIGFFFFAIYARTGNILVTMIVHGLHDLMSFTLPSQATGIMTQTTLGVVDILSGVAFMAVLFGVGYYLVRKSKMADIQATWANIWSE